MLPESKTDLNIDLIDLSWCGLKKTTNQIAGKYDIKMASYFCSYPTRTYLSRINNGTDVS